MATTPTTTTTTPPSTPVIHGPVNFDNLNESWCELQYKSGCSSTGSISHLHHSVNPEVLEKLLQEAQKESLSSHLSSASPPPLPTAGDSSLVLLGRSNSSPSPSNDSSSGSSSSGSLFKAATTLYYLSGGGVNDSSTPILVDMEVESVVESLTTSPIKAEPARCSDCYKHKKQIDILIEKQLEQEKQIVRLRQEYEEKLLTKSPELMSSQSSTFGDEEKTATPADRKSVTRQNSSTLIVASQTAAPSPTGNGGCQMKGSNSALPPPTSKAYGNDPCSAYASGIYNYNNKNNADSTDWMKYWSSRPQTQPPKEWNFVHPNSAKSKYNNMRKMDNDEEETNIVRKFLNKENISKLIFTHMASFIVGATLMFLVLKRHLNIRGSIYFV